MIKTANGYYLHIPKTAGMWTRNILQPVTLEYEEHGIPPAGFSHPNVYAFVRNPWSWYYSMYTFLTKGSEVFSKSGLKFVPVLDLIEQPKSFNQFLHSLCTPSKMFKQRILQYYRLLFRDEQQQKNTLVDLNRQLEEDPEGRILIEWIDRDISYYEQVASNYLRYATVVGKYETLRDDLLMMLRHSGDSTIDIEQRVVNDLPFNVTAGSTDYRPVYDYHMAEVVEWTSKFLEPYKYTYE
jgi:hypothetical protein